jgi:hypothetical protein
MHRNALDQLDATRTWWVPAVVSPRRDWAGAPGCRKGARFVVDEATFHANRDEFAAFDSQLDCLGWIMQHRAELNSALPGAPVRAVRLDEWLLGLA